MTDQPRAAELDAFFRADPHARALGAELEAWGTGWARVSLDLGPRHLNFAGTPHGGVLFALGDVALSVASNSWGRKAVALSVDIQFVRLGTGRLVAEATERSRTRRTASYLIEVSDADGLVASLHAMAYRLSAWHLDEDVWPPAWRAAY